MNFLLVGHGGFFNRGCEAIVRTTVSMLRNTFKKSNIMLSSFDYRNDCKNNLDKKLKIIPVELERAWQPGSMNWCFRQLIKIVSEKKSIFFAQSPMFSAIKKAEVVLAIGGDNFTLGENGELPQYDLDLNKTIKRMKKKLIIWAASIGPFKDDNKLPEIVTSLNLADLITVRDSLSVNYLKQIGVKTSIKRVADPALLLPIEEINLKTFFKSEGEIIGFNISPIAVSYSNVRDVDITIKSIVKFLKKVRKLYDFKILLIPHVSGSSNSNNDLIILSKILEQLCDDDCIRLVHGEYNAMQTKYLISKCRFFIGARMHSTIASLSTEVPTLSIGYSLKSQGLNMDIFNHLDYFLNIDELNEINLFTKFCLLIANEDEIRKTLSVQIPILKDIALDNIRYLREVLTA